MRTIILLLLSCMTCFAPPWSSMPVTPPASGSAPVFLGPFLAHWYFNEGSGTSSTDQTGHGYTATMPSANDWKTGGPGGNAYYRMTNTANQTVNCGTLTPLAGVQHATISGWFNTELGNQGPCWGQEKNNYEVSVVGNSSFWAICQNNSSAEYAHGGNYSTLAGWFNIVMVYDGTQSTATNRVTLYTNGVAVAWGTTSGTFPTTLPSSANQGAFEVGYSYIFTGWSSVAFVDLIVDTNSWTSTQVQYIYTQGACAGPNQ
jgi:hypothetical protein